LLYDVPVKLRRIRLVEMFLFKLRRLVQIFRLLGRPLAVRSRGTDVRHHPSDWDQKFADVKPLAACLPGFKFFLFLNSLGRDHTRCDRSELEEPLTRTGGVD
jgi:hypothetical protein